MTGENGQLFSILSKIEKKNQRLMYVNISEFII